MILHQAARRILQRSPAAQTNLFSAIASTSNNKITSTALNFSRQAPAVTSFSPSLHTTISTSKKWFSFSTTNQQAPAHQQVSPPKGLTEEMAIGIQDAVTLYLRHGVANRGLSEISKDKSTSLVIRWQTMMQSYLNTQVHILLGLGYAPNEQGVMLYNQHLGELMTNASPDTQEKIRLKGRDVWREVLSISFGVPLEELTAIQLTIADARTCMHRVSTKMTDPEILEGISKQIASAPPGDETPEAELARKHTIIQETLVNQVYLGGSPSLVSELGFGEDEIAYVKMQAVMAEYQSDTMVAQYVGGAMMKLLEAAGLDNPMAQK